jgi:uncharacterized protein DUF1153
MLMLVDANETAHPAVSDVVGPHQRRLTLADLPSPHTKRWVIQRKAEVVAAVRGGLLSLEEACRRYALNADEFASWQHCIDRFGLAGLRTTWTQFYHGRSRRSENHLGEPTAGSGIVTISQGPDQTRPTCKRAGVDDCADDWRD